MRLPPAQKAFWNVQLILLLSFSGSANFLFGQSVTASTPVKDEVLTKAQNSVSTENLRAMLRKLTEEPHVAGTPADLRSAEYVRDLLRSWGWSAELNEYEVLLNYPVTDSKQPGGRKNPTLEILGPQQTVLPVMETPYLQDKDSASSLAWPAFHGYGVSGTAQGQVVYANFGTPADFDQLENLGVKIQGKIVLVRYGKVFRGLKVREAQKRGATGILTFSDPADDGFMKGDVYPNGPFRPASAIQRGSVQFLSLGPGDPTTPGLPSLESASRLPVDPKHGFPIEPEKVKEWENKTGFKRNDYFATIPSLPISYEAALPILKQLNGQNVPAEWQGGLPLAYHTGPGPVEVRFSIEMDYRIRKIWNVIGKLEGSTESHREIMIGNHRDAWTYGAVDPSSGSAATLEMCRVLAKAYKEGWRPRRTLVYASWDGEEYGLVGSTEYAEQFGPEIRKNTALMLNVDSAVGGTSLDLNGIPSLRDFVLQSAETVSDPRSGMNLKDIWLRSARANWAQVTPVNLDEGFWKEDGTETTPDAVFTPKLGDLGSGSDYTAFVDHLGVPAVDIDFGGRYGVYHSIYDNFFWMEKFGDPEFLQHATAAKLYTAITYKAASNSVLPFRFKPYALALKGYVDDLRTMTLKRRRLTEDLLKSEFTIPNLKTLAHAIREFEKAAADTDSFCDLLSMKMDLDEKVLDQVNGSLTQVERSFLHEPGLPGRPWYKHVIYAPGLTTGYASWPLPGLRQAVEGFDSKMAGEQVEILIDRIKAATLALQRVSVLLN